MAKENSEITIRTENEEDFVGEVKIADEVVATIARLAAMEVEAVDSMAGSDIAGKFGMHSPYRGVKVSVTEEHVIADLSINVKYGYSIPETSAKVQDKVKDAIENMTGLSVLEVNIKIAGVKSSEDA